MHKSVQQCVVRVKHPVEKNKNKHPVSVKIWSSPFPFYPTPACSGVIIALGLWFPAPAAGCHAGEFTFCHCLPTLFPKPRSIPWEHLKASGSSYKSIDPCGFWSLPFSLYKGWFSWRFPGGGQFSVFFLQVTALFSASQTMPCSAAPFETLQCEGPVSTQDSSCDTQEDLMGPREVDFQVKGYTFSKPFHLIVSYGEVSGRTD